MACYSPLKGYKHLKDGSIGFTLKSKLAAIDAQLSEIACGQCIGCKIQRSKDWAIRCTNEMYHHEQSSFLTFTYRDENLPENGSLHKQHLTTFFKSYRKWLQRNSKNKIRYYACGEYGTKLDRPHYHALIFGHEFEDREPKFRKNGATYYVSKQLEKLWPHGNCIIAEACMGTAAYIAKYVTKKINGDQADSHYEIINEETGEILHLQSEYTVMSTGIGRQWLDDFYKTELAKGFITHEGVKFRIPRYYMDRLEKLDSGLHQYIKEATAERMDKPEEQKTMDEKYKRLIAREKHAHLVMEQELRNLEN